MYCVYCLNIFMRLDINSHLITLIVTCLLCSQCYLWLWLWQIFTLSCHLLIMTTSPFLLYIMIQQSKADWPQVRVLLAQYKNDLFSKNPMVLKLCLKRVSDIHGRCCVQCSNGNNKKLGLKVQKFCKTENRCNWSDLHLLTTTHI